MTGQTSEVADIRLISYVTPTEYEAIKRTVAHTGTSISKFVRAVVLESTNHYWEDDR